VKKGGCEKEGEETSAASQDGSSREVVAASPPEGGSTKEANLASEAKESSENRDSEQSSESNPVEEATPEAKPEGETEENGGSKLLRLLQDGCHSNKNNVSSKEKNSNAGELLKMIQGDRQDADDRLDGFCETSAGSYPMSLLEEPWEHLVRPIVDFAHAKAFVGCEMFGKRNGGLSVGETGSRPQILVDLAERGLMIMFKPSGWATCSTPHWEGNEGNLIRHVWKSLNAPTAAPCHRLDKGTSGIVVVATNKTASKHICQQICQKTLVKQYLGLCHGRVVPTAGAFSGPLALSNTDKPLGTCYMEGREAVTRFRVLGYFVKPDGKSREGRNDEGFAGDSKSAGQWYSLVQVQIDHGRQHQIRLHMASLGHPLVSDAKYNSPRVREDMEICPRLFLHACFLRCMLPPDEEGVQEPFSVACRLPSELKHTLSNVLSWRRAGTTDGSVNGAAEPHLPALVPEANRLCECLLASENLSVNGKDEAANATRLVLSRRDDFLHRFGFNGAEKAEVARILGTLPSPKERSAALQQFRVLGTRTPDFIVARFGKFVEGLMRWRRMSAREKEEEEEEVDCDAAVAAANAAADAAEAGNGDPVTQVLGPVRIHSEEVWCDVCGCEERIVSLEVPGLCLRIRAPAPNKALPRCFRALAWACEGGQERWDEDEEDEEEEDDEETGRGRSSYGWVPKNGYANGASSCSSSVPSSRRRARDEERRRAAEREANAAASAASSKGGKGSGKASAGSGKNASSSTSGAASEAKERVEKEKELMQVVKDYVDAEGGSIDGVWVATKIAARFNQWIRTNSKRNDGSLRKWVGNIPGVSVEHCGKNRWRVNMV